MASLPDNVQEWSVLIIDDHPDNIMVAQTTLEFHDAAVHIASNGAEALKLLDTLAPTVILLDLSMPVMNGWEVLDHIKTNRADLAEIPVIAVTAHAMQGDREKALNAGFDGYIAKPYDIHTLIPSIQRIMNIKRQKDSSSE
jgi:two-component system, cell cycle response regulator DivK